ncbi:NADH-FMN oxidoreductase RutF, flavin reductase (DIM6/NTAB) family [Flavobacterium swingsii]|uniref:NADH-FMN oxidoreductase RutF, flavin reductase (DIM6/NTAB) family n=1 Tax=Flavobacterium swingsii TaxID=498292 RepID=A0A1I0ZWE3_9FLAO|nr:flavin reductase family protein [Flavobacterium swingsii]SFB29386.1 NADH-FMN oxidoreductase RutF, flavin reductase (DIM6/NTAB) family [Flavobacterium swingsii]
MEFDPESLEQSAIYKLLTGAVIPRPIGWISSISEDGILNLAPFSFFNAVGDDPPHVMFSTVRGNNTNKDTLNNVLATKQFVVNMVTEDLVERMNTTSQPVPSNESEFDLANLTPIASTKVKPPRVKESPITMECELVHHYTLENHKYGGATMIIGRIVMFHIDESVLLDNYKINIDTYKPVARLAGSNYSKLGEIFSIKR